MKCIIHWFRRDLRITDNEALGHAVAGAEMVLPVYVLSNWKGTHRWTGAKRQEFLCGCLKSLDDDLRALGGRLILRAGDAVEELAKLALEFNVEAIYFNRDPDPYGRAVEERLIAWGSENRVGIFGFKDVCLHERDEVLTAQGEPFRVFTPYSKKWGSIEKPRAKGAIDRIKMPNGVASSDLPSLAYWGLQSEGRIVTPGEKAARGRLEAFLKNRIYDYGRDRNLPAVGGTSRLSQDLRFGLLSIREVYQRCMERMSEAPDAAGRKGVFTYINELAWREFYIQILWHYPEVLEYEFNAKFRGLRWSEKSAAFDRWCAGQTGFPIVDAGMREMRETGFMHNRVRMITAMFLTKDLHLDWRLGEQWFMQHLVDGDIASNNGGWQWSAGTGADAAPYFRIQNPWLQTKRYDPEGVYIKRWVSELRDVPASAFMGPPTHGGSIVKGYPLPMVDHSEERERTLELYSVT